MSASFAVEAAREIIDTLPRLLENLGDVELRARQARASLLAGFAFSQTKTALAHNISYDITLKTRHDPRHRLLVLAADRDGLGDGQQRRMRRGAAPHLRAGPQRRHRASSQRSFEGIGVKTDPSAYGVSPTEWTRLVDKALEGERGRNFIGRPTVKAA